MRKLLALWIVVASLALASSANASNCFWVGGTGNLNDTTHWSSATGGSGGTCAATGGFPQSASDSATFDSNSGGGTVTDNVAGWSIFSFTMSTFAGTFDDSANNNDITIASSFTSNGAGVRTLNCGTSTWTFTANGSSVTNVWNTQGATNFTENCTAATFKVQPSTGMGGVIGFAPFANESLGNVQLVWPTSGAVYPFTFNITTGMTITSLSASGNLWIDQPSATTLTITNAPNLSGTQARIIPWTVLRLDQAFTSTVTVTNPAGQSYAWMAFKSMNFTTPITASSSYDLGGNTNVSVTAPASGGGGGVIIGGN